MDLFYDLPALIGLIVMMSALILIIMVTFKGLVKNIKKLRSYIKNSEKM